MYQDIFTLSKDVSAASESFDTLNIKSIKPECTDGLNVVDFAKDLVSGNDHRKHVFGIKFKCLIKYALTYRLFPRFYLITQNWCYSNCMYTY